MCKHVMKRLAMIVGLEVDLRKGDEDELEDPKEMVDG